jgi:hypothetical protein
MFMFAFHSQLTFSFFQLHYTLFPLLGLYFIKGVPFVHTFFMISLTKCPIPIKVPFIIHLPEET